MLAVASLLLLALQVSVGTLVSGGPCAQSAYSAAKQAFVAAGGRGESGAYDIAHAVGQQSPVGAGKSDLYELISGVYGGIRVPTSSGEISAMPRTYLHQNYPNPFNPVTTIAYSVGSRGRVLMEIFNVSGQRVKLLVDEVKEPGGYFATWDGRNDYDQAVATGIYLCRLRVNESTSVKKMLIIR